jgi:hypothetical protein
MNPRSPTPLHVPRSGRRALARGIALAVVVAVVVSACEGPDGDGDPSEPPPAAAGLVIVAGEPGDARLMLHDTAGTPREAPVPDPTIAWLSAGREGTLLATLDDGTLRLSDRIRADGDPVWTPVPDPDVELPEDPLYFTTWSPNGLRAAAIASDFGADGRLTLAIIDPVGDASLLLPVPRRPAIAPPTWIDDERVLLQTTVGLVIVDTATGDVGLGPQVEIGEGIGLAAAADGSVVALATEAGLIEIRDLDAWLVGDTGPPVASIEAQGEIGSLALDRRGERLVVVWQQPDGAGTLTIHRAADAWREVERRTLPGESARAVVDWLP